MRLPFERLLAACGRIYGYRRGMRPWACFRRKSIEYHRASLDPWITISNYDGDLTIRLNRANYIGSLVYWHGRQPTHDVLLWRRLIRPGMTVLDIGANQGTMTLLAAKRVQEGHVIAVEPLPEFCTCLRENLAINGIQNVTVVNRALSDRPGRMTMFTALHENGSPAFNEGLPSLFRSEWRNTAIADVDVCTLDDAAKDWGLTRLDVIKVDVEGAELHVLRGGKATLERFRPDLMLENNPAALEAAGSSVVALFALLRQHGYSIHRIEARGVCQPLAVGDNPGDCDLYCTCRLSETVCP